MLSIYTWNVNGLRACLKKGFPDAFGSANADLFCLQETKMEKGQADFSPSGYHQYWNSAQKKGYSGTLILAKREPLTVRYGIGIEEHDTEGRVITLEYEDFFLINCYTPNSQRGLPRLPYRMKWEEDFLAYMMQLQNMKPLILCGDLNVAHKEIDIKNPRSNQESAGFTPQERQKMTELLESGFIDAYRHLYPDTKGAYTWWSYMGNARANNTGWRLDYFILSDTLRGALEDCVLHPEIQGSDHCPVELRIRL